MANDEALLVYHLIKTTMEITVKEGAVIEHEGRHWIITQIGEDNEGQTVIHIRSGDELSVIKLSDMPYDLKLVR